MEYKKLGQTNLKVSRVGFGCWAIGGYGWGKIKDQDSIKAIHKALELGVNFFDTADIYGLGHSEEILSKALGQYRKKVVIATKFGLKWNKEKRKSERDCSPKHIVNALEKSLKRLKLECIPLYQIHWPDPQTPIYKTMEVLKKCQKQGKIKYIGCCNFNIKLIQEAQKYGRLESLQMPYNIIDRDIEKNIPIIYNKYKMSLFTYGPLAQGLLSGKYDLNTKFGKNDIRSQKKYKNFHGRRLKVNLMIANKLKEIAAQYNKTPAQIAIRWILDNSSVTCVIAGIKKPEQIEENVGALSWKFKLGDRKILTNYVINTYQKYNLINDYDKK